MKQIAGALAGAFCLVLVAASGVGAGDRYDDGDDSSGRVVEIRSYNLKPGSRDRFHRLFLREAKPLLEEQEIEIVAYGPSLHDDDTYFLIRAFADLEDRRRRERDFYGSRAWRDGPRHAVLEHIESYTTVVLSLDAATIDGLGRLLTLTGRD